jgi:DNA-binding NarL/FixJ family response regulator
VVPATDHLERGRDAYARRAWKECFDSLSDADPLTPEDLERLATAAYMLGRDDGHADALERAHQAYLDRGEVPRAVRCAFWIGMHLVLRGQVGRATGWFGRAQRLLEREERDCVERGFLLLPQLFAREAAGDYDAAIAVGTEAVAIGERFGDADLFALAAQDTGGLLIKHGRVAEGLRLLDEAMVAMTASELSPIVNGFVYCGVIMGCRVAYEPRRAQEWTAALTRWCEQQPDMVSFTGTCMVHRSELMQLHGAWTDALQEARRAGQRCQLATNEAMAAEAVYREGEVHRLRGEHMAAEQAYRTARRGGREPQPGLALLRLAQGRPQAASAAIRRVLAETADPSGRAGLLPACVEIMLAVGDARAAGEAARELQELGERWTGGILDAMAAHARGAVALAAGNAREALIALRHAEQEWRAVDAPYEAARVSVLLSRACAALGDEDAAALELDAAREVFERLGAAPDLAGLAPAESHGLTARELEVLRLVATGKSNREISAELVISEHTVARHVQNIFAKLGVSSRTAATAYAFEHDMVRNDHTGPPPSW